MENANICQSPSFLVELYQQNLSASCVRVRQVYVWVPPAEARENANDAQKPTSDCQGGLWLQVK